MTVIQHNFTDPSHGWKAAQVSFMEGAGSRLFYSRPIPKALDAARSLLSEWGGFRINANPALESLAKQQEEELLRVKHEHQEQSKALAQSISASFEKARLSGLKPGSEGWKSIQREKKEGEENLQRQFKERDEQLLDQFRKLLDAQPQWRCDTATRKRLMSAHAKVNQIMYGTSSFVYERTKSEFRSHLIWFDEFLLLELQRRLHRLVAEMETEIEEVEKEFGVRLTA